MADNKFRFTNEKCPVCNNTFNRDDDIVVCPECGTPHHRECYKENTKCANHEMHGEDFRWEPTFISPEEVPDSPEEEIKLPFGQSDDMDKMPFGNPLSPNQPDFLNSFPKEVEDGVRTEDVAVFVRFEFPKYLKKFQQVKDGKLSWNWAAFFFAPYWFFYRKLYKLGVIFLALFMLITSMSFLPPAAKLSEVMYDFETQVQELTDDKGSDEEYEAAITELYETYYHKINENKAGLIIYASQSVANLALSVFIGLNANKWYFKHTLSQVKNISSESNAEQKREKLLILGGVAYGSTFLALLAEKAVFLALEMLLPTLTK